MNWRGSHIAANRRRGPIFWANTINENDRHTVTHGETAIAVVGATLCTEHDICTAGLVDL